MNLRAIKVIAKKDLSAVTSNVQIFLPIIIVPLIFCVLMPGMIILVSRYGNITNMGNLEPMLKLFEKIPDINIKTKLLSFQDINQQMIFIFVNYFLAPLFLLIPIMAASLVAANSFAGEKERKTLESLLFAPVDLYSLFLGKALAAFVLAMLLAIGGFILFGLTVNILAYPMFNQLIFPEPSWWVLIFWVSPSLSLLAILFNVAISAKVKGFQEANQMSVFIILPLIALVVSQATGALFLDSKILWFIGLFGIIISALALWRMVKYFNRNKLFESQIF